MSQIHAQGAVRFVSEHSLLVWTLSNKSKLEVDQKRDPKSYILLLPTAETVSVDGQDTESIGAAILEVLNRKVYQAWNGHTWHPLYKNLLDQALGKTTLEEETMHLQFKNDNEAVRSKEKQETIGVSSKVSLKSLIESYAAQSGKTLADASRELTAKGFEEFEKRKFSESPRKLLDRYQEKLDKLEGQETIQWMVRIRKHLSIRLKLAAKEYGRSASQIVAMCLIESLSNIPVESEVEIEKARSIISQIKGSSIKELSIQVGLGERKSLMAGIISGRIEVPGRILKYLSDSWQLSRSIIQKVFEETYRQSSIPAYKAEDEKPSVSLTPQSWEEAVISLQLPHDETMRLLAMKDSE